MLDEFSHILVDKEFKRILLSNSVMWLNMLDKDANVILWNKAAEIISGYSQAEVLAANDIWKWLYPDEKYRTFIYNIALEVIAKNDVLTDFETVIRCKDGSSKTLSWNTHRMIDEGGDVIGSIALAKDITEIKASEQKFKIQALDLERSNLERSRFLAATSHDLRQPLHSLGLFLSVLKSRLNNDEQHGLLEKALHSQEVLSNQLNALMDMAHIDSGETPNNPSYFLLDEFVKSIVEEFRLLAEKKHIVFKFKLQKSVVCYDPIILARIVRNLVSNVLAHCPGSTLLIVLRYRRKRLELCFIDNGPGISRENREDVFSEFFQLNNPERNRNKGMGLGLAIVKRLVTLLGASIELRSKVGKGSVFKLILKEQPLELFSASQSMPKNFQNDEFFDITGKFIFVLDDDQSILSAMREVLTLWGCEVLISDRYSKLKSLIENDSYPEPDLLMVDYRLNEELDGIEVIKALRSYFNANIPAVIVSGDVVLGLEQKLDISSAKVVYKPISEKVLKRVLRNFLT